MIIPQGQKPPRILSQVFSQNGAMPIPAVHISPTREMSLIANISNKTQLPVVDVSAHNSHSSGHINIAEKCLFFLGSVMSHSVHVSLLRLYLKEKVA